MKPRDSQPSAVVLYSTALACLVLGAGACGSRAKSAPTIEITRVPAAADGNPYQLETIEGRVLGARPEQKIVLFARSGFDAQLYEADYDTIELEALNAESGLYTFGPDVVLVVPSTNALRYRYYQDTDAREEFWNLAREPFIGFGPGEQK